MPMTSLQPQQRRLQILLGAAPIQDDYDGYQPNADLDLAGQLAAFAQTRAATLKLVDQLKEGAVARLLMVAIEGGDATQRATLSRELARMDELRRADALRRLDQAYDLHRPLSK